MSPRPHNGKRPAVAQIAAVAVGASQAGAKRAVQVRVLGRQRLDALLAGGGVRRVDDGLVAPGEELLLLQLDALPRRIAEHHVEPGRYRAAAGEHLRELQGPVEEPVFRGQPLRHVERLRVHIPAREVARERRGRDDRRPGPQRLPERGGPELAGVVLPPARRIVVPLLEQRALAADGLWRIVGNRLDPAGDVGESRYGG